MILLYISASGLVAESIDWDPDDFVLKIAFPWDRAFQYVAIEFGAIIVTLYDMFQIPRSDHLRQT